MKRIFRFVTTFCLVVLLGTVFSSCVIGSVTLTYYDKSGNAYQTTKYDINQTLTSLPSGPSVSGFRFKGWGPQEDTEAVVSVPYTVSHRSLYSKYELLTGWYNASSHNYSLTNLGSVWAVEEHSLSTYEILINDNNSSYNITSIRITPATDIGGNFAVKSMKLLDQYANEIEDSDDSLDVWIPKNNFSSSTGKYVLSVTVETNGSFRINVGT